MFKTILKRIAKELDKHKIPYMVIGGQAVLIYGEPRFSKDIDITIGMNVDKFEIMKNIADNLSLEILVSNAEDFVKSTMVLPLIDRKSGIRVDFIFSFSFYEKQAIERAVNVKIDDVKVKFASLEDIMVHKIIAGRARDIEDVKNIILKNPDFDRKYVVTWLNNFDKSLNENFLSLFRKILKENEKFR